MARSQAPLHVVPAAIVDLNGGASKTPVPPETTLRRLFRREAALEQQLLEVRRSIGAERARYAAKHKLGCFPAIEALRRLFR